MEVLDAELPEHWNNMTNTTRKTEEQPRPNGN